MHREIKELLEQLLLNIQYILTDTFIGMYIGGSVANNCFAYETSDIDCYVITTSLISENKLHAIANMHQSLYASNVPCAQKLEVSYISQHDLLDFDPQRVRPYFNEGQFNLAHYGSNFVIELYVLREKGITFTGPDIKQLLKKISEKQLKQAIQENLHEYWENNLSNTLKFNKSDYQVFAILTMCRTLYSLETGKITSKSAAAKWAMHNLANNWKNLIAQALIWKPPHELNKSAETKQFIKWVIDKTCY